MLLNLISDTQFSCTETFTEEIESNQFLDAVSHSDIIPVNNCINSEAHGNTQREQSKNQIYKLHNIFYIL